MAPRTRSGSSASRTTATTTTPRTTRSKAKALVQDADDENHTTIGPSSPAKSLASSPAKRASRTRSRKAVLKEAVEEVVEGPAAPAAMEEVVDPVELSPKKKPQVSPSKRQGTPVLGPRRVNVAASTAKKPDLRTLVLGGGRRDSQGATPSPSVRRPARSTNQRASPIASPSSRPPAHLRTSPMRASLADVSYLTDADAEGSLLEDSREWTKAETSTAGARANDVLPGERKRGHGAPQDEEWNNEDDGEWTMEGEEPAGEVSEVVEKDTAQDEPDSSLLAHLGTTDGRPTASNLASPVRRRPRSSLAVGVGLKRASVGLLPSLASEEALFDEYLLAPIQGDAVFQAPLSIPGSEADRLRSVAEAEDDLRYGYACLEAGEELVFEGTPEAEDIAGEVYIPQGDAYDEEVDLDVSLLVRNANQSLNGLNELYERIINPPVPPPVASEAVEEDLSTPETIEAEDSTPAAEVSVSMTSISDDSVCPVSPPHPTFSFTSEAEEHHAVQEPASFSQVPDAVEGSLEETLALASEGNSDPAIVVAAAQATRQAAPAEVDDAATGASTSFPPSAVLSLPSLSEALSAEPSESPLSLVGTLSSPVRPAKASSLARPPTPPPAESHATPEALRRSPINRAAVPSAGGRAAAPVQQRRQLTALTSRRPPLAKAQSLTVASKSEDPRTSTTSEATEVARQKRPSSLTALAFGAAAPSTSRTQLPSTLVKRPALSTRATAPAGSVVDPTRPTATSKARTYPSAASRPRLPAATADTSIASTTSASADPAKAPASRLPGPAARVPARPAAPVRPRSPIRNVVPQPSTRLGSSHDVRPAPSSNAANVVRPTARPGLEKRPTMGSGRPTATAASTQATLTQPAPSRLTATNRNVPTRPLLTRPPSAPPVTRPEAKLAGPTSRFASVATGPVRRPGFMPAPRPASASSNSSSASTSTSTVRSRPAPPAVARSRLADSAPLAKSPTEAPQPSRAPSPRRGAATLTSATVEPPRTAPALPPMPVPMPSPTRLAARVFGPAATLAEAPAPPTPRSPRRVAAPTSPQRQAGRAPSPAKGRVEEAFPVRLLSPIRQAPALSVEAPPSVSMATSIFSRSPSRTTRSRTGLTERIEVSNPDPAPVVVAPTEAPIPEDPLAAARARAAVFMLPPRSPRSPYKPRTVEPVVESTLVAAEPPTVFSPPVNTLQLPQGSSGRRQRAVEAATPTVSAPTPTTSVPAPAQRPRRPKPDKPRPQMTDVQLKQITHQNTTRNGAHFNTLEIKEERMNCVRPPSPSSKIRRSMGAPPSKEAAKALREDRAKKRALRDSTDEARRESLKLEESVDHFIGAGDEEGGYRSPAKEKPAAATALGKRKRALKDVKWDRRLLMETDETALSSPRTARVRIVEAKGILKEVDLDHLGNVPEALQPLPSEVNRTYVVVKKRIYDDDEE